jgi:heat shock protein HslJ
MFIMYKGQTLSLNKTNRKEALRGSQSSKQDIQVKENRVPGLYGCNRYKSSKRKIEDSNLTFNPF